MPTRIPALVRSRCARPGLSLLAAALLLGAASARAQNTWTVDTTADDSTTSSATAQTNCQSGNSNICALRDAILAASSGDTIQFSVTGTITLTSALPTIGVSLTITGPGASQLTISGADLYQVFSIGHTSTPTVSISSLTIANGFSSTQGGGIAFAAGGLTITNCAFTANNAAATGGGAIDLGIGTLTVADSTFSGNSGFEGGAIRGNGGTLAVINSTFSGNSAPRGGGAILNVGSLTVTNSTFSGNSAPQGGAVFNGGTGTLIANNNVFSGNTATNSGAGIKSSGSNPASPSYNVFYNNLTGGSEDDCNGCASNSNATDATSNPLTLPLGNYGGTTQTFLPQPGSAAICAGSASLASAAGLTTDQRGFPLNSVGCVDAGADQTNYITVISLADNGGINCVESNCTLRVAITLANDIGQADIDFDSSLTSTSSPGTITLGTGTAGDTGLPAITGEVNLIGPGANQLTISGNNDANVNSVFIFSSTATATLYGLTIAAGKHPATGLGGGGITNSGTLTVIDSTISGNSTALYGGGIFSQGTLMVTGSTVSGNSAQYAGGINNYGALTVTVTNSTISNNIATDGGGGIINDGTLALADSTLSNNSVTASNGLGGGIRNDMGTATVTGSTFSGNISTADGGGIYNGALITVANSTFSGNSAGTGQGGGIYNDGASFLIQNSVLSGDSAASGPECGGPHCPSSGSNGNVLDATGTLATLSPLGNYGGPTQTMVPLPDSSAICAGSSSLILTGVTTDQRGYPLQPTNGYCASGTVDAGAVQTNYTSLAFVQQPLDVIYNAFMFPAPTIQVVETDTLLSANNTDAVNVTGLILNSSNFNLTDSAGRLNVFSESVSSVVELDGVIFNPPAASGDTLTADLTVTGTTQISGTSNSFNVDAPLSFNSAAGTVDDVGLALNFNVTTTGGVGTVTLAVSNIAGPIPGITVPASGNGSIALTGTPTSTGTETFTITATDADGEVVIQDFSLTVNPAVTFSSASSTADTNGVAMSFTPTTTGGTGAVALAVSNVQNAVPGISITGSGTSSLTFSGTPTASGIETLTITATDAAGGTANQNFTLTVNPAVNFSSASSTSGTVTEPLIFSVASSGGTGTVTLAVSNVQNAIPGVSLPSSGSGSITLTGTPTATGVETFTTTATDSLGSTAVQNFTLTVGQASTTTTASSVGVYALGLAQNVTLSATVTGGGGTVNEGQVTFTVIKAPSTIIGTATSGAVTSGTASVSYALPGSLTIGTYTIQAAYGGSVNYQPSLDNTHGLFVNNVPSFVVNQTTTDDASGNASNCPASPPSGAGSCGLRDALAASGAAGAGVISFDPSVYGTTITETHGTMAIPAWTWIDGSGANMTVRGSFSGPVFSVGSGDYANIGFLTITGAGGGSGSGIKNNGGALTVSFCTITNNSSASGGGINTAGGSLTVGETTISSNIGNDSGGGGIYVQGSTVQITGSTITGNHGSAGGGGISIASGTVTITTSTISGNGTGTSGGGIAIGSGTLTLNGDTLSGNTGLSGGSIYMSSGTTVNVNDSTFSGTNHATTGRGGAIDDEGGTANIAYSTFNGNSAKTDGGAIFNNAGAVTINNGTISGNSAAVGGGIFNQGSGTFTLANTIVAGNTAPTDNDGNGSFTSLGYNLIGDSTDMSGFVATDLVGTSGSPILPDLAILGNYGGPTLTMLPLPGSPAICAGGSSLIPVGVLTDQRGTGFPNTNTTYINSSTCVDVGAVQTNYTIAFSAQPSPIAPAHVIVDSTNFTAAVTVKESNSLDTPAITVPLTLSGTGTLSGASASTSSGVATFPALQVSTPGTGDSLTANLVLNGPLAISATSSSFNVIAQLAGLTSPKPSSVLSGPTVTFSWNSVPSVTGYKLRIGTSFGSDNLYSSGPITNTSVLADGLPTNGETVYVTLVTVYGSVQENAHYTFTAATQSALTAPTSTVLSGPGVPFTWSNSPEASAYELWIGTSARRQNLYTSGSITTTNATPVNLPTNGETLYVTLVTAFGSSKMYADYTFTAATQAALTSPTPGTVLVGPAAAFTWSSAPGSSGYKLWIGSSAGKNDLYTSGPITTTSATAAGLPGNGETIYVTLVTVYGSSQVFANYTFTAATQAALTSPTLTVLAGPTVMFNWNSAPKATAYKLWIGTSPSTENIYTSGPTTATSATPVNLPTNGETLYVTLVTVYGSSQVYAHYTFTATTQAALTSPTPSTQLPGASVPFAWSVAPSASGYQLWVGTSARRKNLGTSGPITTAYATLDNLPTNGETVYVTLVTIYGSDQVYADYTFTAASH